MSIILKPGKMNVRQSQTGDYVALSGVTDATIAEVRAALRSATDAALAEAVEEGRAEMAALVAEYTAQITASQTITFTALTAGTGVTTPQASNYGNGALKVGKLGNVVFLRGGCTVAGGTTIATLPSGYRPSTGNQYWLAACGGNRVARLYISPGGSLVCEWIRNLSDGGATSSAQWVDCNHIFTI